MEYAISTLNCRGKILDLSYPQVMGILNLTPDSFYDGGKFSDRDNALIECGRMLKAGASIIDIGGMSSRPGAKIIPVGDEIKRVASVITAIRENYPEAILSLDTVRSEVARVGLELGVHILNDISAGQIDSQIWKVAAAYQVPYVLMHMQGVPENMQENPNYGNVLEELFDFFSFRIAKLRAFGVQDIILDPGFGFGKSVADNYLLLKQLAVFKNLELPILVGLSRKSMICKVLGVNPPQALNGTTALHMVALQNGARILRVHDVREAVETIKLWHQLELTDQ
ncbi:MAG: dihydropteroate synthase [Saprospiraceae bacterium]|nr:dihydropteroate synthase [Saprospiraceae bacterium]